ncbi:MAG: cytochrome c oxidase subunit 3 [Gammaproteobacteria bacterium]|nr:cytochrome c oxidase subunit 3 [Gammaproteobacteria bacterium]MDH4254106.1 cytochrome c oxidase subunit 3 [Gammaproteobacteria bacterium]MDH5309054.1 cytochrome c oxidase subunit 3 [Gammaproteobacteria bacterium]
MTITLVFLAVIMATVIGWLLRQSLNTQPWVSDSVADSFSGASLDTNSKTVGLTTFLAVATSLFALFVSAYTIRMRVADWSPLAEPDLLWVNSAFLVLASVVYHWTRNRAVAGRTASLKPGLMVAGALSIMFLVGQLVAWQQLLAAGQYASSNAANAFFYLLTGVHGLHMLGGLYVWARSAVRAWTGADADAVRLSIELCTVYWHFLLLVWVVLFGLLLAT